MSLTNQHEEKRDYIRMRMETQATLTLGNARVQCVCVDLSGTGMCLELKNELQIGDDAVVHMPSYQNKFDALNACIRIKRVMQDGDIYCYGAEIIELLA